MSLALSKQLKFFINSFASFIYVVSDEEDRVVRTVGESVRPEDRDRIRVFSQITGLVPWSKYVHEWVDPQGLTPTQNSTGLIGVLSDLAKEVPQIRVEKGVDGPKKKEVPQFYVIVDPDIQLKEPIIQRWLLTLAHQVSANDARRFYVIMVGQSLNLPPKLKRYFEVIQDPGLSAEEHTQVLANRSGMQGGMLAKLGQSMVGLTAWEARGAILQNSIKQITAHREAGHEGRADVVILPKHIQAFKQKALKKNDLLAQIDVSDWAPAKIGGLKRFKAWAEEIKATWTDEGRKFGLTPPRGVLCLGVWGAGKSSSVKMLGHSWNLPIIQLEMGKLRSSLVGHSEQNLYSALADLDKVGNCIVWIDEAEKSFSGGESSNVSDAGVTSRMMGILSTWIQETKSRACIAMTANSTRGLPPEFVNRVNEKFFFDVPTQDERIEILKIHIGKVGQSPEAHNLFQAAKAAKDLVGREIEQVVQDAMTKSFIADKEGLDPGILVNQLKNKTRIMMTMQKEVAELREWVGFDKSLNDGIKAHFASDREHDDV